MRPSRSASGVFPYTTLFRSLERRRLRPVAGRRQLRQDRALRIERHRHRVRIGDHDSQRSVLDRKSTRLNSSHVAISYAVFCLKKKKQQEITNCTFATTYLGT